jgi:hypothetical protein
MGLTVTAPDPARPRLNGSWPPVERGRELLKRFVVGATRVLRGTQVSFWCRAIGFIAVSAYWLHSGVVVHHRRSERLIPKAS